MKVDVHVGLLIFLGLLLLIIGWYGNEWFSVPDKTFSVKHKRNFDIVTLKLPNSPDTQIFGSKYWEAFHKLAGMIPCPACRSKAVPFMRFFHDIVNKNTGKKLYDPDNYAFWVDHICKNKNGNEKAKKS